MKRLFIALLFASLMCPMLVLAGGIVTNANQSAAYIRMPAQDAAININALYYNPAGLAFIEDGFHVSISNQYILQNRKISSSFPMARQDFKGGVVAPLFPSLYIAYKKDKVAFSLGFNPVGGGGSAMFEDGLPSFEKQIAVLPPSLSGSGIPTSQYSFDTQFEGKSTMYGFQFNASYALTEKIAISLGVRYIIAKNSYIGDMKNIMINPNQTAFGASYNGINMVSAPQFFTAAAATLNGWATGATQTATAITSGISGGSLVSGTLVNDLPTGALKSNIIGLYNAAGQTVTGATTIDAAATTLPFFVPGFRANANKMTDYAGLTADKAVDAEQTGTGISPIIGVDLKLSDKLNIGIRYEHKAEIKVQNKTKIDNIGLYSDGAKVAFDMPSTLSVGVSYKPMDKLMVSGGMHYYFDKGANYGKKDPATGLYIENKDVIDNNFVELAFGCEYSLNEKFLVSAGYLRTQTGVNELYQSDLSHSLTTNTFGAGFKYSINEKMAVNLGGMYSMYVKNTKDFAAGTLPAIYPAYTETYNRTALVLAVGIDFRF